MILGSSSKSRRKLVENLGWEFESPDIDEKSIRSENPYLLPLLIAQAKAEAIINRINKRQAVLVTADQVILFKGEIREKPVSIDQAHEFLRSYSENNVKIINAMVVTNLINGEAVSNVDVATIQFGPLSEDQIESSIKRGECFSNAGGIDSRLYNVIDGDITTVLGMNMRILYKIIRTMNSSDGHI
jgi:septum formation protein